VSATSDIYLRHVKQITPSDHIEDRLINVFNTIKDAVPYDDDCDAWLIYGSRVYCIIAGIDLPDEADWDMLFLPKSLEAFYKTLKDENHIEDPEVIENGPDPDKTMDENLDKYSRLWGKVWTPHLLDVNDLKIQAMRPRRPEGAGPNDFGSQHFLLLPVACVDIVCCGLAMTPTGNLIELVPGAYEDAMNRVVRRTDFPWVNYASLNKRIDKLVDRGFHYESLPGEETQKKTKKHQPIEW